MNINEKMGIPDGIEKQGQLLYDKIMKIVKEDDGYIPIPLLLSMEEGDVGTKLLTTFNLRIKELSIRNMPVKIKYTKYPMDAPKISGLSVGIPSHPYMNKDEIKLKYDVTSSDLYIDLSFFKVDIDGIKSALLTIRPEVVSHELMHLYDTFKSKEDSLSKSIEYRSYIGNTNIFPRDISLFLYTLYYTSSRENLVRPTELYHKLLDNKITKRHFYNFVSESDIMNTINLAIDFNLERFISKLDNDPDVRNIIDSVSEGGYVRIGSYGVDIMNILFNQMSVGGVEEAKKIIELYNARFRDPNIGDGILYDNFNKIISKYDKYSKNPIKFFKYLEKKLNFDGNNMKRKLFKLYDMVENTENKDSKSILDWELHNKINSKNEKLITKYPDFSKMKLNLDHILEMNRIVG